MASKLAIYAFSGDPITFGHLDVIKRARQLFPRILVAIGTNPDKTYTFSIRDRVQLAKQVLVNLKGITVKDFSGLLVDFAYEQNAAVIVKGVRDAQDFQYEQTLNSVGLSQSHGLETVAMFARPQLAHISSGTVKAVQKAQGLVHDLVPLPVKVALEQKISQQTLVGITGEIASGKSHLAENLIKLGKQQGLAVHNIELDQLAHQVQNQLTQPQYKLVRQKIIAEFGDQVRTKTGGIDRQSLGELVFNDPQKLNSLNQIMWKPVLVRLRRELKDKQGLILVNSALLAEADLLKVCNNRVILTEVDATSQRKHLKQRGFSTAQIKRRLQSQFSADKKRLLIEQALQKDNFGTLWQVTNQANLTAFAQDLFTEMLGK
ncbi:MAG TPA: pantetheine-phosphate adenylyltransferase [Patescibacteria group bacterium]|jgi:pantetheine-phosphate adenylyltransferase